jgi:hypothetical protein
MGIMKKLVVTPELQKKATDWVVGLKRAIKRKNANNVAKRYKYENTYLPDIAENLKEDDLIKFSPQPNASVSIVLGIENPIQGRLTLKLQKKTNGEIFYHPTPTNRTFWKQREE